MDVKPDNSSMNVIYVDRLTKESVKRLLKEPKKTIIVLDEIDEKQKNLSLELNRKGVNVSEASFFAGHLRDTNGESVYLASRRIAFEMAIVAADEVIKGHQLLQSINTSYKRNTILLSLAKEIAVMIEPAVTRVQVVKAIAYPAVPSLWMTEPQYLSIELFRRSFPELNLYFYKCAHSSVQLLFKKIVYAHIYHVFRLLRFRLDWNPNISKSTVASVLMVQEDNIRVDRSLRGQPHWLDLTKATSRFTTYISDLKSLCFISDDVRVIPKSTLSLVGALTISKSWFLRGRSKVFSRLSKDRLHIFYGATVERRYPQRAALLHVYKLLLDAERIGALAFHLNSKVFVTLELNGDAIQLVAEDLNIKTVAVQYSNLGFLAPFMLSTADYYVLFSGMYKKVFATPNIFPKNWHIAGYIYGHVPEIVRNKAISGREELLSKGVKFIICYFDESVQAGKWGLVSTADHLGEIQRLARAVLEDSSLGVITKSQFLMNSPSRLYPNDELIQQAVATGRFLELMDGKHRNDIYPSEAALMADICIGHKFGATAALEAAIAGVRTILIDDYGCRTLWDDVYDKANIEYSGIDEAMLAVKNFRLDCNRNDSLGDWSEILHHFDSYRDGRAASRLKELVDKLILDKKV